MIDPNLLNKIQAIKTLRDRAGTDGEKDAAQNRLTIILAKHKLTEQDIPAPGFSTRGRAPSGRPSPFFRDPPRQRTQPQRSAEQTFSEAFNQTMRDFEEAVRRSEGRAKGGSNSDRYTIKTSAKTQWKGRLLHEMARAYGFKVWKERDPDDASLYWHVEDHSTISFISFNELNELESLYQKIVPQLKRYCRLAISTQEPSNPNAFRRAFYEAATLEIADRLRRTVRDVRFRPHYKAKERKGLEEGRRVGQQLPLRPFA